MAFNPTDNQLALMNMGLGVGSGLLQGAAQGNMNKDNQRTSLMQLIAQLQQRENENRLSATQMDPLSQQRSRAQFSAEGDVMRNAKPVSMSFDPNTGWGDLSGGMAIPAGGFSDATKGFYAPGAAANAEAQFYGAAGMPYDLAGAGYGNAAEGPSALLAQTLANRPDPLQGLQGRLNEVDGLNADGSKKSSGWAKFAKIAGIAGAGLATAMTMGGASPLLAGAIGMGSGALSGAANGGVRGALTGAGMAAIPTFGAGRLANVLANKAPVNYAAMGVK